VLPISGHNLSVFGIPEPKGKDLRRKISLLAWLPFHLPIIWREIRRADAVHAPIPGDIGLIGLLIALTQRKPLFVRHCGTWGNRTTQADRFIDWLLPRIAGGRNVVLATGGGDIHPSSDNPNISWIFSTTMTEAELIAIPETYPWRHGESLRLVTVSRMSASKNTQAIIRALPRILAQYPDTCLDVVGDGDARPDLEALAAGLGVASQVVFHGNVHHDDVLRILSQSHLFVFPTRVKEGFPKAILEALACGLPVIGTNVSVIPYLISDSGYVLPNTEPDTVANAVLELIADEQQMADMAVTARQTAKNFTLEAWRDNIGSHLEAAWGPLKTTHRPNQFK